MAIYHSLDRCYRTRMEFLHAMFDAQHNHQESGTIASMYRCSIFMSGQVMVTVLQCIIDMQVL